MGDDTLLLIIETGASSILPSITPPTEHRQTTHTRTHPPPTSTSTHPQLPPSSTMPSRSDYQPLRQSFDDEDEEEREEVDVGVEGRPAPAPTAEPTRSARGIRRAHHPGNIDLRKLDTAFKRCAARSSAAGLRGVDGSRSRVCVFVCGRWSHGGAGGRRASRRR